MASEINDLTNKTTPVSTDEVELQATGGGASAKATVGNLAKGMSYNDLNDKPTIGDVAGPASSTDNAIARFDSTTGKLLQNSGVTVSDSGSLDLSGQYMLLTNSGTTKLNRTLVAGSAIVNVPTVSTDLVGDDMTQTLTNKTISGASNTLSAIPNSALTTNPLARANHTGTQTASTISDFDTEVANNSAVTANTAKISYTDAAKVATIETNADVTDTANVTAAGALMDSEVTNLAQVKAFDSSDYATAAQGGLADTATQPGDLGDLATQNTVNNTDWSGTDLSVANGGTGVSTLTSGNFLIGAGTSAVTTAKAAPSGTVVGTTDTQTLTNKDLSSTTNTMCGVAFHAYRNASRTIGASFTSIIADTELYDLGGNYDTSTGVFTAPVAGIYCFTVNLNADGTTNTRAIIQISASTYGTVRGIDIQGAAGADQRFISATFQVPLALSETVDFLAFLSGNTNVASPQTYVSGFMITRT